VHLDEGRDVNALLQYTIQGLAAGSFYALSALGLAIIFGVLGVVNFAHGACYMLGAVTAAVLLDVVGLGFWLALLVVPVLAQAVILAQLLQQLGRRLVVGHPRKDPLPASGPRFGRGQDNRPVRASQP
jgi:branched-subunit amino acid ABC-type transport system permease component